MPVLSKFVSPGNKVDLMIARGANSNDEKKQYKTMVYDIVSDDEIKLNMPMEGGRLVLLSVGMQYDLCFYTESGLYQCFATVKERYKNNNVFIVTMELTSGLRKFQRREYYRLNCIIDVKCTEMDPDNVTSFDSHVEFMDTDFSMEEGIIVDISGGGIRFVSKVGYEKDTNILFSFELRIGSQDVKFKTVGRILISTEIENRPGEYENRVQFTDMNVDDRETIIRYIFEEERRIRRKERIDG